MANNLYDDEAVNGIIFICSGTFIAGAGTNWGMRGLSMRFSRSIRRYYRNLLLLTAVSIPIIYNSCDNGFESQGLASSAKLCKINHKMKVEPNGTVGYKTQAIKTRLSPFSKKKLWLNSAHPNGAQQKISTPQTAHLAAGQQLAIVMDNLCLMQAQAKSEQDGLRPLSLDIQGDQLRYENLVKQTYIYHVSSNFDLGIFTTEIENDPCIVGVAENHTYQLSAAAGQTELAAYNDPDANQQAHLRAIHAVDTQSSWLGTGSSLVAVAVLDTGISASHSDLAQSLYQFGPGGSYNGVVARSINDDVENNFQVTNEIINQYNPTDSSINGHGTHVSGIIAASTNNGVGVAGVAGGGVKIMSVQVFYRSASDPNVLETDTTTVTNAIRWAAHQGARVINLSLQKTVSNGQDDQAYIDAIGDVIADYGVTVIMAAGNGGPDGKQITEDTFSVIPARYADDFEGAITVGSVDIDSNGNFVGFSSFSHYSPSIVEIAAPGRQLDLGGILSTLPTDLYVSGDNYGALPGTSMAAPMVAAAAAMFIKLFHQTYHAYPSPATVESVITEGARAEAALQDKVKSGRVLDLSTMLAYAKSEFPSLQDGPVICP